MYDTLKEKQVDDDILAMEEHSKTSLVRLERHIRDYYISKGYIINPKKEDDWGFKIVIETYNKHKTIEVTLADKMRQEIVFDASASKLSELFEMTFEHFGITIKETISITDEDGKVYEYSTPPFEFSNSKSKYTLLKIVDNVVIGYEEHMSGDIYAWSWDKNSGKILYEDVDEDDIKGMSLTPIAKQERDSLYVGETK